MQNIRDWFQTDDQIEEGSQHGQILIITARWALALVGLVLTLNKPQDLFELQLSIVVILSLAVANFFLHVSVLTGRPIQRSYMYAATIGDVAVVERQR